MNVVKIKAGQNDNVDVYIWEIHIDSGTRDGENISGPCGAPCFGVRGGGGVRLWGGLRYSVSSLSTTK